MQRYIAVSSAAPSVAARYTEAIVAHCEKLSTFPLRGFQRDDIRPGLRVTNYRKRAVIAYSVDDKCVSIIGVFYGGQNYEATFKEEAVD